MIGKKEGTILPNNKVPLPLIIQGSLDPFNASTHN
jgi:hypothetical protein